MTFRFFNATVALMLLAPGLANASDPKMSLNVSNWDVFQKLYPARAIAAHEEGAVGFVVTLDSKGAVTGCQVTHSSGHPLLDEETCKIITLNAQFKADAGLSPSQVRTSEGVITWKLPASTTVLTPPMPVTAAAAPEKIICKKNLRIGTLSGYERTCMTPSDWAKQSDEEKQTYDELQGRKGSTRCGPGGQPC